MQAAAAEWPCNGPAQPSCSDPHPTDPRCRRRRWAHLLRLRTFAFQPVARCRPLVAVCVCRSRSFQLNWAPLFKNDFSSTNCRSLSNDVLIWAAPETFFSCCLQCAAGRSETLLHSRSPIVWVNDGDSLSPSERKTLLKRLSSINWT